MLPQAFQINPLDHHAKAPGRSCIEAAGYALWCFIIQREACGLRDQATVIRQYRVPAEVRNRMGVFPGSHLRLSP